MKKAVALGAACLVAGASAEVYFKEQFEQGWKDRWVVSEWKAKSEIGEWKWTAGTVNGGESDKGIQTGEDARFYGISSQMPVSVSNKGKDLVVQFSVKHDQTIDCGGGYLKLLPAGLDQKKFGGDSEYGIMFGPDICGTSTRKTHVIFNYAASKKSDKNLQTKKSIRCETDNLTHLYTLIVRPDNTYEVQIDQTKVESGKLVDDFDFLEPKLIKDPALSKPSDWVDEKTIPDPSDVKPAGYDDIPAQIPDANAKKPDDWDDEDDGEWEAPLIDNPEYKGAWAPKMISNPAYKGPWVHPEIANPAYVEDNEVYHVCRDCNHVGFELWQVKAGTIFDDIFVGDDLEEAKKFASSTWGVKAPKEKAAHEAAEKAKREKEEAERKEREAKEAAEKAAKEEEKEEEEDKEDL